MHKIKCDNMEIIGPILITFIAGLSTVLGSIIIFLNIKKERINAFITFCLSFSLAIMIGISITDLIPHSFFNLVNNYSFFKGIIISIVFFILGAILIAKLSKKIEEQGSSNNLYRLGILNMLALMLHNLPEGIATFMSSYQDIELGLKLAFAIMLHNIPEGISIAVPIYYATKSKSKAIMRTLISGFAEPLGAILTFLFLMPYINETMISIVLMLVAGIMISLSINKLLPESLKYKEDKYIYLGLISGTLLVITCTIFF